MICINCKCRFTPQHPCEMACQCCQDAHIRSLLPADVPANVRQPVAYKPVWPENLYVDVFGCDGEGYPDMPDDAEKTIEYVMSKLSDQQATVIRYVYREGYSNSATADLMGLSPTRIGQIIAKLRRLLNFRPLRDYMIRGLSIQLRFDAIDKETRDIVTRFNAERDILLLKSVSYDRMVKLGLFNPMQLLYDDLPVDKMGFSKRCYNVLARSGYDTLSKFIGKSYNDIRMIRNAGDKSVNEIIEKLKEYGIIITK